MHLQLTIFPVNFLKLGLNKNTPNSNSKKCQLRPFSFEVAFFSSKNRLDTFSLFQKMARLDSSRCFLKD